MSNEIEDSDVVIFGAGLSGLIAAKILADRKPIIMEKQDELPNNHAALLRFRTDRVSLATNIPFDKVRVIKGVSGSSNPVADAVRYSKKVTGGYSNRSISDLKPADRYVAPQNFIQRLSKTANFSFSQDFMDWTSNLISSHPPVVSTLPMPYMMDVFQWKDKPDFKMLEGWTLKCEVQSSIQCNLNATLYFPGNEPFYRVSVTGRSIMIEGLGKPIGDQQEILLKSLVSMGLDSCYIENVRMKQTKYQKISELTSEERESAKRFVMWLSDKHNIHSLGRFATWRPKLLLDDIPNDVQVIARLIDGHSNYDERVS